MSSKPSWKILSKSTIISDGTKRRIIERLRKIERLYRDSYRRAKGDRNLQVKFSLRSNDTKRLIRYLEDEW